jgi:hypothetical protein
MSCTIIKHMGVATGSSSECWSAGGICSGPFDTSFCAAYAAKKSSQDDVIEATIEDPLVLPLENVVKVRVLIIRSTGSIQMLLTSPNGGTDQAVALSGGGLMIFHLPTVGDEITAIKFVGDEATVSYFIAGDVS